VVIDQSEIHRKTLSDEVEERRGAVKQLEANFAALPDREEAWNDLHRLTGDDDSYVRFDAAYALGAALHMFLTKRKPGAICTG